MTEANTTGDTKDNADQFFEVGEIVGVHGLGGQLKIRISTNSPALLTDLKSVFLYAPVASKSAAARAKVTAADDRPTGWHKVKNLFFEKRLMMLKIVGVEDRTAAEKLVGMKLRTERSQLNELEEEEWWISDLVGLDVYDTTGVLIGTVTDLVGEGSQLLEIRPAKVGTNPENTVLVPFVKALVPTVDIRNKRIEIVNLPGLIDEAD